MTIFFGNQGSDDEKVRQKITMMASVSKHSEKPKNRIGKKYFWSPKFWPKNCPGVSRLFFFETYSGKETQIGNCTDLENKPNMEGTRISGGYMVVGYGSGGGIWIRIGGGIWIWIGGGIWIQIGDGIWRRIGGG